MSIDVLGYLVEILSGQSLSDFMKERIWEPLGMKETGFWVNEKDKNRLVTMFAKTPKGYKPAGPGYDSERFAPSPVESGGGGLVSTLHDVDLFARALSGLGKSGSVRLLSRKTVELMRTNHLTPEQLKDYDWDTQRGYGYGLGVRVMMQPELAGYGSVGEFAWDGMAGTYFSADPSEELSTVFLIQTVPGAHGEFVPLFEQAVYGAFAD
jgi:CubicO group peptidase (beta-lactamase class C family)